jgi:sulfur-carrier protein
VRLLYFAWVREQVGVSEEELALPPHVATVADLIAWLAGRSEAHGRALAEPARLRAAVDQTFVGLDTPVAGAREVAIFPPVTGG